MERIILEHLKKCNKFNVVNKDIKDRLENGIVVNMEDFVRTWDHIVDTYTNKLKDKNNPCNAKIISSYTEKPEKINETPYAKAKRKANDDINTYFSKINSIDQYNFDDDNFSEAAENTKFKTNWEDMWESSNTHLENSNKAKKEADEIASNTKQEGNNFSKENEDKNNEDDTEEYKITISIERVK